jgi:HlyD family secretion protein
MKKLLATIVCVAAGGAGWYYFRAAEVPPNPEIVRAAVSRGPITETVQATGTIEPQRRVNVGSQVSGTVTAIYADFNSVVTAGQLLAEIDPTLFEMQVKVQEAAVERQKNDIATQEMQLADVKRTRDRVQELYDKQLQPLQQLEAAELTVRARESQVLSAKKQLVQTEAALEAARLNLSYTKIYAPIDGVVVNRRVDRGQTVQASMTTPSFFMLTTPLQLLKLNAMVDEADVGRVRPGQTVRFRVNTFGQELFTGTVDAVRLNAFNSNSVVTYPVWVSVPNDDLRLRPGMTATVHIEVSGATEVVRVPNDALRFRPTRAMYQAFGKDAPETETLRAVDMIGDRVVDPTALREGPRADATTIDALFAPLPRADSRGTVWTWNAETREFLSVPVRVGVSDGTMTELIEGDLEAGDQLVTGVILPQVGPANTPRNPLLGGRGGGMPMQNNSGGGRTGGS